MSDSITPIGMGLTARQNEALHQIVAHVGRHGIMPSRRMLAAELHCQPNNANRLMTALVERGEVNAISPGGALTGFGRDGVAVFIPAHIAADLANYCATHGEKVVAFVADAIVLHLDQIGGGVE